MFLRQIAGVHALDTLLESSGLHEPVVDEQQEHHLLHVVVDVADVAGHGELEPVVRHLELDQLLGDRGSVQNPALRQSVSQYLGELFRQFKK